MSINQGAAMFVKYFLKHSLSISETRSVLVAMTVDEKVCESSFSLGSGVPLGNEMSEY
jgi:hypothetical protein